MLRRTFTRAVLLAVTLLGLTAIAVPASADGFPRTIATHADTLHPEGVTWDPTRQAFLVGSMRHGTVSIVEPDGRVRPFIADDRMIQTFGLHVDARRGRLLVTYADIGNGVRSTPETGYRASGVGIFDLRTGRPLHLVDLNIGPGRHGANDLALDAEGNAYVTDPASDAVYRVTPHGKASVLARDPRFASPSIGLNGIVWHPAGYLLAVRYDDGRLLRIDVRHPERIAEVRLPAPLLGGDGLALRPDGTLLAVTNDLGVPGKDAVTSLRPRGNWSSATVRRESGPWPFPGPTTVAVSPHGAYALTGRVEVLMGGGTSDEFELHRF